MMSVKNLMKEYFSPDEMSPKRAIIPGTLYEHSMPLPVVPDKFEWKVVSDPERFMRRFEFSSREAAKDFVVEILHMEDQLGHHGKITIEGTQVDVEVHTHTVDCITELDQDYVHQVDQILEDVNHYGHE